MHEICLSEKVKTETKSIELERCAYMLEILIAVLVSGAPHGAVYSRLERMRRDMNRQSAELWEDTDL